MHFKYVILMAIALAFSLQHCGLNTPPRVINGKNCYDDAGDSNADGLLDVEDCKGIDGSDGKDGVDGSDGSDGKDGVDGSDGSDGKDGKDGIDGSDGKDGKDGIDGSDGKDGKDGIDGSDGSDGKDGKDGIDGSDGKDGKDGIDGSDGKDGIDGSDGKDGIDGSDGKDGIDGKDSLLDGVYFLPNDGFLEIVKEKDRTYHIHPESELVTLNPDSSLAVHPKFPKSTYTEYAGTISGKYEIEYKHNSNNIRVGKNVIVGKYWTYFRIWKYKGKIRVKIIIYNRKWQRLLERVIEEQ